MSKPIRPRNSDGTRLARRHRRRASSKTPTRIGPRAVEGDRVSARTRLGASPTCFDARVRKEPARQLRLALEAGGGDAVGSVSEDCLDGVRLDAVGTHDLLN